MSATAVFEAPLGHVPGSASTTQRLVVAWQHPGDRSIRPVGLLSRGDDGHDFVYLASVRRIEGFRPLLGFPDLGHRYRSPHLFPLFAQRAMDPRRDDYTRYVDSLGLDPERTDPWEQIARSRGHRHGDTLQLFPVPQVQDGRIRCTFLVHGHRHIGERATWLRGAESQFEPEQVERALAGLAPGDHLLLEPEPENRHNPEAVLTVSGSGVPVGYVPDLLVHDLHRLRAVTSVHASVARVNPSDAPTHLRLLVDLAADGAEGFTFFSGPEWLPLA